MAAMFEGHRSCEIKYDWHALLKRGQRDKINRMKRRLEMRESAMKDLGQRTQRLLNVGYDTQWSL
jgi:hypothetical protein